MTSRRQLCGLPTLLGVMLTHKGRDLRERFTCHPNTFLNYNYEVIGDLNITIILARFIFQSITCFNFFQYLQTNFYGAEVFLNEFQKYLITQE
jgi:hypothetical protein